MWPGKRLHPLAKQRECDMARILLTEDDEAVRSFVKRALELDGHTVCASEDGGAALETLVRERGSFDLLLSDIKMPVMDGIALALATARDWPSLPILLMTGFADQRERANGCLLYTSLRSPHPAGAGSCR